MEEDEGFDFPIAGESDSDEHDSVTPDPVVEKVSVSIAEGETKVSHSLPNRRITTFTETFFSEKKLKFLIQDVLPDHGIVFFGGLSGTGKTILAIQLTVNLVMNRPTMTWFPVPELPPLSAMMLSLEMSEHEWHERVHAMYPVLTDEEEKILGERFFLYSEPEPFKLWRDDHCADLIRLILQNKVNVVLIDSASVSFAESLKDSEAQINKSLENLDTIRVRLKVCIIIVAHTRKPPAGEKTNPENVSINDLFGHSGIAQHASSIFLMYEDEESRRKAIRNENGDRVDKIVHIVNVKTRFGSSNAAFKCKLPSREKTLAGTPLLFRRNAIELQPMTDEQKKAIQKEGRTIPQDLDFGSILGDEDEL